MIKLLKTKKWQKIIKESNLFDIKFYLFTYSDIRDADIDPIEHFVNYGASEGRNPSSEFSTLFYLEHYNDVKESGINPFVHYILHGKEEGRFKNADELNVQIIESSQLFDKDYYLSIYPDVKAAEMEPITHYVKHGASEGRNPSSEFNTLFYLEQYNDVQESGINPFVHYILYGKEDDRLKNNDELNVKNIEESQLFDKAYYRSACHDVKETGIDPIEHFVKYGASEGRNPSSEFNTLFYLEHYNDVRESNINPLVHYILYGKEEGRLKNTDELNIQIIEGSQLFDKAYYLSGCSDAKEIDIDPIEHFVKYGVFEGKNPANGFDTLFYLERYNDVLESGINPLVHYILYGKGEGRKIFDEQKAIAKKEFDEQKAIVNKEFDSEYYLNQYPDVDSAPISAIDHFCSMGWKEQRNPNSSFDTAFYLKSNPDVQQSDINPFYHYLISGRNEGRLSSHPAGYRRTLLEQTKSPQEILKSWSCELPVVSKIDELKIYMESVLKKPLVISFSHDRYIEHIGGVQVCIAEEQLALSHHGYSYINISPACPLPILSEDENWHGDIIINNEFSGTYKAEDILAVFKNLSFKEKPSLVIHALHGHSETFLKSLYDTIVFKQNFFWIHDYYTICENYNLLRNNLVYCGGPNVDSQACQICVYGGVNRKKHIDKIKNIFEYIPFKVIAPSQTALDIWLKTSNLSYQNVFVNTHRKIKKEKGEAPIALNKHEPLRIGFLGHGVIHKGWFVFKELVERFKNDRRYEFYHLGMNTLDKTCTAKFFEVKNNWENMTNMQKMIREINLHVSFLWSIWPETYNIVTYEALASGSTILTNKVSGNISAEIKTIKQGLVLDSDKELFEIFENGKIRKKIECVLNDNMLYGSLESSDITASFIKQK